MKRLAALVVACALAAGLPASARAETTTGATYITTFPSGADIWVDGTYVGRAPVLVDALLAGHHALTITKTGWVVRELDVTIPAGGVFLSSTRLAAGPRAMAGTAAGTAIVRSLPVGAALQIDGQPVDRPVGRPIALAAGPHRVTMTTGRGKMTLAFEVFPDTSTGLVLAEPESKTVRSAVVAPADDYLPDGTIVVEGKKIVIRYEGHVVVAHLGETDVRLDGALLEFGGAPETIGGRLYLPLELLEKLSGEASKSN